MVGAGGVNAVLVGDDLPELGSDLVAALTGLNVDDFSHFRSISSINVEFERRYDSRSVVKVKVEVGANL